MRCNEKLRDANLGRPFLLQVQAPLSVTVTPTTAPLHLAGRQNLPRNQSGGDNAIGKHQRSGIWSLESRSRISDLGSRISSLGSRISDLGSQILDLESRVSDLASRISSLGSRISELGSRISRSRISDLESRIHSAHLPRQTCKLK